MRILVTGFDRFGKLEFNPTERALDEVRGLANSLEGCELVVEVLPTEFVAAGERVRQLLVANQPDAFLGFGVAPRAQSFLLERFALNIDDAREPDNAGLAPAGIPIVAAGPAAYRSTLPLEELFEALGKTRIPVAYSNHAGSFVCNHVFYVARHHVETACPRLACGFVHVPLEVPQQPGGEPASPLPPMSVAAGMLTCIEAVRRALERPAQTSVVGFPARASA
jgi:pyroglutamyl-peptidase